MTEASTEVDGELGEGGAPLSLEAARVLGRVKSALFARTADVTVDRFVLIRRLGAGGMGEVMLAYDPELDRKVAIKLVHRDLGDTGGDAGLLREARAAARLQHPNVVMVFELGRAGVRLFVAMEYVEGRTLRAWLRERPRSRHDILSAFEQAGRGLVAAHDAGLVHRDFKPDNVLVGDDGRVRVADFGIASLVRASTTTLADAPLGAVGTPRYMAPEQFEGRQVDARADQFAFCVALWEAIAGESPFVAGSFAELAAKVTDGALAPPPRSMPRALVRVLTRGLQVAPSRRYADMRALLDALARVRTGPRRRAVLVGVVGAALLVGTVARHVAPASTACTDPELPPLVAADDAWVDRLAREGESNANAERARAVLEAFDEQWRNAAQQACAATHERGERSAAVLDTRMACLTRLHGRARVLVDLLSTVDRAGAWRAIDAAVELPAPARCVRLEGAGDPDEPCVAQLDARLDEARALRELDRRDDALVAARAAVAAARSCGPPSRLAEARTLAARLAADAAIPGADDELRRAATEALSDDAPSAMAEAATRLAALEGAERGRPAEARAWIEIASAAAKRSGDDALVTEVMLAQARIELETGTVDAAAALADAAWTRRREELGDDHPQVARALGLRAWVEQYRRRWDDALALHAEALGILERWYPPEHPVFAGTYGAMAVIAAQQGRVDEAERGYRRAIALLERARGPAHRELGAPLTNLADLLAQSGRTDEALALVARVEAIAVADHGDRLLDAAVVIRGIALAEAGRLAESEVAWRRVLELRSVSQGPDDPGTALAHDSLCRVLTMAEKFDEALEHCRRAIAIDEFAYGRSHPSLVGTLELLADAAEGAGRTAEAVAALERAAAIVGDGEDAEALRVRVAALAGSTGDAARP